MVCWCGLVVVCGVVWLLVVCGVVWLVVVCWSGVLEWFGGGVWCSVVGGVV